MPVITLVNENKTLEVIEGANLRKSLLKHGVSPYMGKDRFLNCFGFGLCGTCRVEVIDGKGAPAMTEREQLALVGLTPFYGRKIPKNVRLSCRINVTSDLTVKTYPTIEIDWQLTKERMMMTGLWTFFGAVFALACLLLLMDMMKVL
jgi:ferredoxin